MRSWLILAAATAALATGCQQGGSRGETEAGPEAVKDRACAVLAWALDSNQPRLASMAAETFMEADRLPPVEVLRGLAESADPRVRTTVVALLGTMRRPDLKAVFQQRLQDPDPAVRLAADFGLAMAGDTSEVLALRDALASPNATLRRTAAWLLGLMGNRSAVGMLRVRLSDPDAVVALRAVEAIHRLGGADGVEVVRDLTENERHEVRYYATRLLGQVGGTADIPRLERLCQSRFLDVKFAAIAALIRLGDLKRVNMLLDMLDAPNPSDSPDMNPRVLAARELGETAYTPAVERLGRLLAARDPLERTTAAAAILRIQSARQSWRTRVLADKAPPQLVPAAAPASGPRTGPTLPPLAPGPPPR